MAVLFHGGAEGSGHTHTKPRGREYAFGEDRGHRAFARTAMTWAPISCSAPGRTCCAGSSCTATA